MVFDYLIVGQGLAGTVLAYTLLSNGKSVLVVDEGHEITSSRVAAGLFNPITGKKFIKTWEADTLFPFLGTFYSGMEAFLQSRFFHPMPIYRPFKSIEEQNYLMGRSSEEGLDVFLATQVDDSFYSAAVHNDFGGFETKYSGYVDVPTMLDAFKRYLISQNAYIQAPIHLDDLVVGPEGVSWQHSKARRAIFCQGYKGAQNPYFKWLPFAPVKGEVLTLSLQGLPVDRVVNNGFFVAPAAAGLYKAGATYSWHQLDEVPSRSARQELERKATGLLKLPFEVVQHQAGIRPAVKDRRPLLGLHPDYPNVGIFNGLGTKGVSLAPYFANHLYEFLENGKELDISVNIDRFTR